MKNFLITGALGFIASNFVNYMSKKYPDNNFIVLDKKDYCSSIENINQDTLKNTEIIIGNIKNHELVTFILHKYQIDNIVHFAAQSHVDNSFYNSIEFTENNVLGTHNLLESARIYHEKTDQLEKFIHVSTDEVYGEVLDGKARCENAILDPTNPYAASKAAAEFFVKSYYYSYKLPVIITRGNNVYGMNQYPEKIVPKFICRLLEGKKLTIQGSGQSKRNFIHVDDVVTAFETILLKGKIGDIYNIGGNHDSEYSVMEITYIILKLFYPEKDFSDNNNFEQYVEYVDDRYFNDARYFITSEKLEKLGWSPIKTDLKENLKELIKWYSQNKKRYTL